MQLSEIFTHPVKSLRGINLTHATVTPLGLDKDRQMMLVDSEGEFITQRKYPALANIGVEITENQVQFSHLEKRISVSPENFVDSLHPVVVWNDSCQALEAIAAINQWFSEYLGFHVRLMSYSKNHLRPVDQTYGKPDDVVSFADGFPLLVISEASLADLNSRLDKPVTMRNFRPNLVIAGGEAYQEDQWKDIKIGSVEFEAVKLCSRCVLTTVDPETGSKREDKEPLKTLSQYRRAPGGVMFGMNLIPRSSGQIKLGDPLEIIS